jgi:3-phosphoshikimate 1-carboxyvinyltransferase
MRGSETSQHFSALAIAAPFARADVSLECVDQMSERPYLDITLDMMAHFGAEAHNSGYREVIVRRGQPYSAGRIRIEGDYSSASFFFLAAAICESRVMVMGLPPETKQGDHRFLGLIARMGCRVSQQDDCITVEGTDLCPISEDMGDTPDLVPPIAIAAAFAEGESIFTNVARLRYKECDRIAVIASELAKMGVTTRCDVESLTVQGTKHVHGARINPHNDHRIAMSFAVAGLATGDITIMDEGCVAKSFPGFWDKLAVFDRRSPTLAG